MPRKPKGPGQKGSFSDAELPVAASYPMPAGRRRALLIGAVAALLLLVVAAADLVLRGGRLLSNGPLSSSHAVFAEDCANCHFGSGRQVTDEKCSACHEKYGDEVGVFTFASHYLYRSDDFRRVVPSAEELPCYACHLEHEGREAQITRVADTRCTVCHEFASFNAGHPEFDFAIEGEGGRAGADGPSALAFPHIHHVREVMKREALEDVERSCLYCHNADADGRGFEPIDFDRHCDACHLTATTSTPGLPVAEGDGVGVEPLEAILARGGPGVRWAAFANPGEYRRRGGSVVKTPVYHRDPWILDNLRALRQRLYPDAGLADLLVASAEVPPHQLRTLYEEAIATLREQAAGLRGRPEPEIQGELARITELLGGLERAVRDPYAPLDETRFPLALGDPRPELSSDEVAEIEALVTDLTEPCRNCHRVTQATFARVDTDLRALRRAEFDHRSHIVQRRCLDCHAEIPVEEWLRGEEKVPAEIDRAEIRNLPRIDSCRQCHTSRQASNRCVRCHLFHPEQGRRSDLLLYLE